MTERVGGTDPVDGGQRRGPLSGFVIVLLREATPDNGASTLEGLGESFESQELAALLRALGSPPTRRQVTSVDPGRVRELERGRDIRDDGPDHSLTKFWRIDLRELPDLDVDEAARRFTGVREVLTAYAEIDVDPPPAAPRSLRAARASFPQLYLAAAPQGVGARAVAGLPGGRGENAGLVDVEQSWRLTHPDLSRWNGSPLWGDNLDPGEPGVHGNGVVGVVAADGPGPVGIAPKLRSLMVSSHAHGTGRLFVTDAITAAVSTMQQGDVLVVEVQRGNWPTEIDYTDFQAIRMAVGRGQGKIVIEPAGDGHLDVDGWTETLAGIGVRVLARDDDRYDSGAIMVGACRERVKSFPPPPPAPPVPPLKGHVRLFDSNWGRRVDCHAWGEKVETCSTSGYERDFRDTSAAAAVLAGLAVLAQSLRAGAGGVPLTCAELRRLLLAGGTPQAPESGTVDLTLIGTMPDMAELGPAVAHAGPI